MSWLAHRNATGMALRMPHVGSNDFWCPEIPDTIKLVLTTTQISENASGSTPRAAQSREIPDYGILDTENGGFHTMPILV